MKKYYWSFLFLITVIFTPGLAQAASWKPVVPEGYQVITWAKAPGVATFFKAPQDSGSIDFLTRIYLPQNEIRLVASSSLPLDWGAGNSNFATTDSGVSAPAEAAASSTYRNLAFARLTSEVAKAATKGLSFMWNGPFFNTTLATSDLSMAIKTTVGTSTLISSGSRPEADMAKDRRMLIVNNQTGTATIGGFNYARFISAASGDEALEGFGPGVFKSDGPSGATARVFLGVSNNGQELVVYCSQQATVEEASAALLAAGVSPDHQLQADGGGSASCGYNLPGQFFVEPTRSVPLYMGAIAIKRGTSSDTGINVRSGPATKNTIVKKLKKGELVRILEEKNGWYRIGDKQWVLGSLIKKM